MRFRKSISICKGVKVNLSKTGMSYTVGTKGLSLNFGRNGTYLNTGIPGTGLYNRRKLSGGAPRKRERERQPELDVRDYELYLDEEGQVEILDRSGRRVSDDTARKLRRTDWYGEQSDALMQQLKAELDAATEDFVSIHRKACKVAPLGPAENAEEVERCIEAWLSELELPMEFYVQYEYSPENGALMVDLDLPEVEDLPQEKAVEMAGGVVKPRTKALRELREEYRACVLGLAVFLASHMFDLAGGVRAALVSGYTQRRDRTTGEMEDCYVFSIAFEREMFETDACRREDPVRFCNRFRSRINALSTGELKKIVPYTPEEFREMLK